MPSRLSELKLLRSENPWVERAQLLSEFLRVKYENRQSTIKVLEAGCGRSWPLDLGVVQMELTGIDFDSEALAARKREVGDLHRALVGDLREVDFEEGEFDLIYSCEVLEHIKGAEGVLERLFRWLNPEGAVVLIFPDRDTVFGVATRCSPHWVHVAYHKYIMGMKNAGAPGFAPYKTFYDRVISRRGMHEFCARHGYTIALEYGRAPGLADWPQWFWWLYQALAPFFSLLSAGRLSWRHIGLVYIIEKNAKEAQ